jgi:hypothetical protein
METLMREAFDAHIMGGSLMRMVSVWSNQQNHSEAPSVKKSNIFLTQWLKWVVCCLPI